MEKASTEAMTLNVIAHIHTAFPTKFGIPRQSGLVDSLRGEIIFTPEYRNPDAVRGLEDFSHIWLVWQFSGAVRDTWSPTVRPPRLGGNPIYDIKPYIPYADCHPDASAGFTAQTRMHHLNVECDPALWARVPEAEQEGLRGVLAHDPRPSYQHDPARVYGMEFAGLEVHFTVDGETLTVTDITRR